MRSFVLCLALSILGCSNLPPDRPPPPVRPAPAELSELRIHVVNASSARARAAREDDVTGFTLEVRGAFQSALARAGYVVIVEPTEHHDLDAQIDTDYQSDALVTSLALRAPGGTVDQLSGSVRVGELATVAQEDVVELVERLARSERLLRYAARLERPDVPCAPRALEVASPAGLEPDHENHESNRPQ